MIADGQNNKGIPQKERMEQFESCKWRMRKEKRWLRNLTKT